MHHFMNRVAAQAVLALAFLFFSRSVLAACPEFTVTTGPAVGTTPYDGIASADFNADGMLDLAVANFSSSNVSILLAATTTGVFSAANHFTTGTSPIGVAAGDLNRDGRPDLVTANYNAAAISVLLNNGNGTFATKVDYTMGTSPRAVALADFNNDGKLDVVTADYNGNIPFANGNTVSVKFGDGNGAFGQTVTQLVGYGPSALAVSDFNRDGFLDIAVSNAGDTKVSILLGNGSTFTPAAAPNVLSSQSGIVAADLNRDGIPDLAVLRDSQFSLSVLIGAGDGAFGSPVNYTVPSGLRGLVTDDFNGDGKPDLVSPAFAGTTATMLAGNGDGTLQPARSISFGAGTSVAALLSGDFNFDARPDLAAANYNGNNTTILLSKAECGIDCNTFAVDSSRLFSGITAPKAIATADFNGDGTPDLAIANGSTSLQIRRIAANGTVTSSSAFTDESPVDVATGDFDGNGTMDVVSATYSANGIVLHLNDGDGDFPTANYHFTGLSHPTALAVADFNRDGKDDVVVSNEDGAYNATIYVGGASNLAFYGYLSGGGTGASGIATADFNRDGKADVVVSNGLSHNVSVYLGNGGGGFGSPLNLSTGANSAPADVAVIPGALPGIAVANYGTFSLGFMSGNGDGTFGTLTTFTVGGPPTSVIAGDFNVDGDVELAATVPLLDSVVRFGDYEPNTSSLRFTTSAGFPVAIASVDINRDGRPDLLTANQDANAIRTLRSLCATTTVADGPSMARYGVDTIMLTATVTSPALMPAGQVEFREGDVLIGTGTLNGGAASYDASSLSIGTHTITAVYLGDSEFATSTSEAITINVRLGEPENLTATPVLQSTRIDLTWSPVPGATSYRVYRLNANFSETLIGSPTGTSHSDTAVSLNTTYLYQVRAVKDSEGGPGPWAAATLVQFTDDPLVGSSTRIKAVHITELRAAVNVFRARAGLGSYPFSDQPPVTVKAIHLQELRTALSEAYAALGFTMPSLTDPTITVRSTTAKAAHFNELRAAVRSASGGLPSPG